MRRWGATACAALFLGLGLVAHAAGPSRPMALGPRPPAAVRRIVTLAPSLTEMVLALGEGGRLVGVSRFDDRPEVASLPRVGGFVDPSVEAVVALRPDLVLVQPSPGNHRPVEKMAEVGLPVLALPLQSVEDVLGGLRGVGQALGVPAKGEGLARQLEQARSRVRAKAAALPSVRVLFVYGFEPLIVAGPGSFAHELLVDAGGHNVVEAAAVPYPVYSVERALTSRPDVVVDASGEGSGTVPTAERLQRMPGLSQARWVKLPSQALLHPGPRLAQGLEELFGLLHPGDK